VIDLAPLAVRAAALDIALHTVQVDVGGRPVATAACAPLGIDTPQRMYSVSKTVTGLAVGLLAADGMLSLDDPVVAHFPEFAPMHPWMEATTLRHMLAMRGPHRATTFKRYDGGWLESYFRVPPTHPPGTLFTYDTSASYVLAALVERLSGTSVAGFLRPRLLDPLGVDPGLRFLTSPEGTSHGGSGLICTPRDLLRLARLLVAGGVHDGARLLPADYLAAATGRQADTATQTWGATLRAGYGYQLWLPERSGWLMFGLGGQMVYGDPARRLAVVVTADAQACASGDQRLLDDVLDLVVDPLVAAVDAGAHEPTPEHVELAWPTPGRDGARGRAVDARFLSLTPGTGPAELHLAWDGAGGRLRTDGTWDATGGWDVPLRCGKPVTTQVGGVPAVVTAGWSADDVLDVRCALHGDDLATLRVRLAWAADGTVAVQSQAFCESADPAWTFHAAYGEAP
jgi:CubicO group peptidase (beta-lactamase class C family)